MSDQEKRSLQIATRLKNVVVVIFAIGFLALVAGIPLTVLDIYSVAVPLLTSGGSVIFIGILISLCFNHWIDEVLKKTK